MKRELKYANLLVFVLFAWGIMLLPKPALALPQTLSLENAVLTDVAIVMSPSGLKVEFGTTQPWTNIRWNAPAEAPWDWSSHKAMVLTVTNPGSSDVPFFVRVDDDPKSDGIKHCITASAVSKAHQTQLFFLSLNTSNSPQAMGMRAGPPIAGTTLIDTRPQGAIDPHHIAAYQIFCTQRSTPLILMVDSIVLSDQSVTADYNHLVDKYGQYQRADWPGKIHADTEFAAQRKAEQDDWKAHPAPMGRDKWGGWSDGPKLRATGFFRTEQRNGKWWLVDPDGHLFLSIGIASVLIDSSTVVGGRETMFSWLPSEGDSLASHYGHSTWHALPGPMYDGKTFDFYRANLERKYGPDVYRIAGDTAIARLTSWGFNTFGNFSVESAARDRHFPYVAGTGAYDRLYATVPSGADYWGRMPDPFDPAFAASVDRSIKQKAAEVKDDPMCVGYFFDNELSWGGGEGGGDHAHFGLSYGALSLDANSPAKQAFIAQLKGHYDVIGNLNKAWGTSFPAWDDLLKPYQASTPLATEAQRSDFSNFLSAFASKYFEIVSKTIKRYDTNHMYLGCRFAWFTPEAVKASAKYVDVISFNIYHWDKSQYQFAETLDKPVIVGEFHFGALDRGMFSGGLVPVKSQQERGERFAQYVRDVLSEPAFVGVHWFQYADEPTTGRSGDGENYNIGFVSITDTPYPELIASARAINAKVYAIHDAAK